MARKPLSEKNVALNVLKWRTGGINIDESRVEGTQEYIDGKGNPTQKQSGDVYGFAKYDKLHTRAEPNTLGRFPSNLIHDGSDEVKACFPETKPSKPDYRNEPSSTGESGIYGKGYKRQPSMLNDSGNASRFFKSIIYQAKASKAERNRGCEGLEIKQNLQGLDNRGRTLEREDGSKTLVDRFSKTPATNNHPTVKPIALMAYLIKMVTPKGGVVLDPFAGSGSTLVAAKEEGFEYVGIDITPEYIEIINARLAAVTPQQKLF